MSTEIDEVTELAYEGGAPLTTTPTVEPVRDGEVRVTVLGSSDEPPAWWADALITD